jgi:hypothetical protein
MIVLIAAVLIAAAAAGAYYVHYRVNQAVAECDTPAPPAKPHTPPPNLPGFAAGEACGPGEAATAGVAPAGKKR